MTKVCTKWVSFVNCYLKHHSFGWSCHKPASISSRLERRWQNCPLSSKIMVVHLVHKNKFKIFKDFCIKNRIYSRGELIHCKTYKSNFYGPQIHQWKSQSIKVGLFFPPPFADFEVLIRCENGSGDFAIASKKNGIFQCWFWLKIDAYSAKPILFAHFVTCYFYLAEIFA